MKGGCFNKEHRSEGSNELVQICFLKQPPDINTIISLQKIG